ncbi:DivIVA domain-containing protein [Thermomonospora umbrina]|uniref:Cell wall synthesis protein Wag31 n=1 Tax=Thermomonospora umbrina TaxID=111806 RepID=A0A3D9SQ32_9ACTN|nr:DivIVA domain-containing protein [Thermomonospora umbrina]REE98049.1 DivIVA domain-containing protein [Thermomonospora umbrina]
MNSPHTPAGHHYSTSSDGGVRHDDGRYTGPDPAEPDRTGGHNLPATMGESRLTPAELQSVTFPRAPLGRRGYDEERVRSFLQYIERELAQIFSERTALADEVARLRERLSGVSSGGVPPEEAHFQAVRILSQAQQTADLYVADAERYTRELAQEARQYREAILSDAKSQAELLLDEAHRRASAVAETAAAAAPPPQHVPSGDPSSLPDDVRRQMEREIAYLRTYSEVYRTHLRSYLESLLRNVDEWERSERDALPTGATEPPRPR